MVTRLNGFSSGMDIDDLVRKLMTAQRLPLDKLEQKRQTLEWQRDEYRNMNTKILDFRNTAFDMKLQSSYLSKKSTSSDESIVTVNATTGATEGTYTLKVNALATAASLTSGSAIGASDGASSTLSSIGMDAPGPTTITISGQKGSSTIQVNTTDSISSFVNAVNSKSQYTGVKVSFDSPMDRFFFTSTTTGAESKIEINTSDSDFITDVLGLTVGSTLNGGIVIGETFTSGTPAAADTSLKINEDLEGSQTFRINYNSEDYDFTITSTTTVAQLLTSINSSGLSKEGVTAYLDESGVLSLFNPDDAINLTFADETADSEDILTSLGLNSIPTAGNPIAYAQSSNQGVDAEIEFNGIAPPVKYSSNTFAINGMNFTAKKVDATAVNITVTQDVDSVYNTIKLFIDKYNELIDSVYSKVNERKYREYTPLTQEQKTDMSEEEIEKWEEKAKSGLLRSDSILTNAYETLRLSLSQSVGGLSTGDLKQLAEIGISTTSYLENGKLYINETKLKEALSLKADQVMNLFTANDNDRTTDTGDGLAVRLYDLSGNVLDLLKQKAGTTASINSSFDIGKELTRLNDQMDKLTDRLAGIEDRYYRQFTAMEKALNQMNSQSSYLLQQFSGQ